MRAMTTRAQLAWLLQRAAFGPATGQLDALGDGQSDASVLDQLVDPGNHGVADAPDPWAGIDLTSYDPRAKGVATRALSARIIGAWLAAMATTPRPLEEWMRWFWHGHFVSTVRVVKHPPLMVGQLRTLGAMALGDVPSLLRAVTTDPAMLAYLDGDTNLRDAVNENYGREVLELFSLGVGNYTEADVRAGATALTGYRIVGRTTASASGVFDPRRHDDTHQTYLGTDGVHDLDGVVDAIVAHPACAPFITTKLAHALLGPGVDQGTLDQLASDFAASGLQLRPLVQAILQAGLDGRADELAVAPVPSLVSMIKATSPSGLPADARMLSGLTAAGQLPLDAPNVAGWPGGRTWLSSSTTIARFNLAAQVAAAADQDSPARQAARNGDLDALADRVGRPTGFTDATRDALSGLADRDPKGTGRLAVALSSPDLAISPPC